MFNREWGICWFLLMVVIVCAVIDVTQAEASDGPVWPPPPEKVKVAWVDEINCEALDKKRGFLGGIANALWGGDEDEILHLPFDLLAEADRIYMVCQDYPFLVVVDQEKNEFTLKECSDQPMISPVALAKGNSSVYISDSARGIIYRFHQDKLKPWITHGLVRPTGIACSRDGQRIYVVDTGDHSLKIFDSLGTLVGEPQARGENDQGLNFPTFAAISGNEVLVNDTLNYQIKRLDRDGELLGSFGQEGSGPGAFARPKGIGVDPDGNIWVVDAVFDNIQVFGPGGRLLLVVGGRGNGKGEFWSPCGIAIDGDLVYVADTFNNRVQILRYLGGGS
jgi:DNA-binding beta-propeller fold protein YncE